MNPPIRFSHDYKKFKGQKNQAELIAVKIVKYDELTPELIKYDTQTTEEGISYKLPKTTLIKLFFEGEKGIPFCTLRRHTPEKYAYYRSLVGKTMEVIIA